MFDKRLQALAVFSLIGFAAAGLAQDKLSGGDEKWMEKEVGPIITKQEISTFEGISKDDRKLFKELFWMRRDFNRTTQDNEFREDYEARVKAADQNFKASRTKGSESDMGKIFLLLGTPSKQQRGRVSNTAGPAGADAADPGGGGGLPDDVGGGPEGPGGPEGEASEGFTRDLRGGNNPLITWIYDPNPQLGIPDGLNVVFRNQAQLGYRLANGNEIEERLERVKERLISNPGVNYARDENGRLNKPDDRYDPNSPAKLLLAALRETGETSSDIEFTLNPIFFRSTPGQVFIPIDVEIAGGVKDEDVTIFGSVENADGFEIYQFEEPAKIAKTEDGKHGYELPLQLAPGLYTVYVGLLSKSQLHGTTILDLEVPDYEAGGLTLSSMLVFSDAEQTGDAMAQFGNAFLLGGYHFTPKRERTYSTKDEFAVVFNAYNFAVEGDKPNMTVQVRFFKDGQGRGQTKEEPFMLQNEDMALTIYQIPLNIPNFKEPSTLR